MGDQMFDDILSKVLKVIRVANLMVDISAAETDHGKLKLELEYKLKELKTYVKELEKVVEGS